MLNRKDFACHCGCGFDTVDFELKEVYDFLKLLDDKILIHCACRCPLHNAEVGGARESYHLVGKALDFHSDIISNENLYDVLNNRYKGSHGIILYNWGIHIDCREKEYREKKV